MLVAEFLESNRTFRMLRSPFKDFGAWLADFARLSLVSGTEATPGAKNRLICGVESSNSTAIQWCAEECARFFVSARLRTPLGDVERCLAC